MLRSPPIETKTKRSEARSVRDGRPPRTLAGPKPLPIQVRRRRTRNDTVFVSSGRRQRGEIKSQADVFSALAGAQSCSRKTRSRFGQDSDYVRSWQELPMPGYFF
jgi:hypothetical protein